MRCGKQRIDRARLGALVHIHPIAKSACSNWSDPMHRRPGALPGGGRPSDLANQNFDTGLVAISSPPGGLTYWSGQPSARPSPSRASCIAVAASSVTHRRQTSGWLFNHQIAASAWLASLSIRHIDMDA